MLNTDELDNEMDMTTGSGRKADNKIIPYRCRVIARLRGRTIDR
jgi:hypothetical protein